MSSTTAAPSPFPNNNQIHRKPLQPKNTLSTPLTTRPKPERRIETPLSHFSNKENIHPTKPNICIIQQQQQQPFDSSLAEELNAIREKLERLRIDREKTEKMLKERDLMLDFQMKEVLNRGEMQKDLELEVDRLFRLNELRLLSCMKISPIRTLREKEEEKKIKGDHLKELNYDEEDDIMADSSSENNSTA